MWDLIVSVPGHFLSFYFDVRSSYELMCSVGGLCRRWKVHIFYTNKTTFVPFLFYLSVQS